MRGAAPRAGHFLLRGQEKVTKEKAALRTALRVPCATEGSPLGLLAPGGLCRQAFPGLTAKLRASVRATLRATPPSTAMQKGTLSVPTSGFVIQSKTQNEAVFPFPWGAAEHRSHFRGSEGMFERGGFLPRELPERPEMTRSAGNREAASLREMVLGTFD